MFSALAQLVELIRKYIYSVVTFCVLFCDANTKSAMTVGLW